MWMSFDAGHELTMRNSFYTGVMTAEHPIPLSFVAPFYGHARGRMAMEAAHAGCHRRRHQ